MRRPPLRLSGRLYFFPAFLPLAEMLPWLLTAMGVVAGAAGFSFKGFWSRHGRRILIVVAALCFTGAGGAYLHAQPDKAVVATGTRAIALQDFPLAEIFRPAPDVQEAHVMDGFGEVWSKIVKKQILSTPSIAGNLLFFGTLKGSVEAVSLQDGDPVWSLAHNNPVFSVEEGVDGIIYASEGLHDTQAASLTAIEAQSGRILWQREFLGHLEETPAFNDDKSRMWISAGPGGLWAVDARNGDALWNQPLGHIDSKPLVTNGVLYVPVQTDEKNHATNFYALDADKGHVLWKIALPGQPWGSPQTDKTGGIILTSTGEGQIGVHKETDKGWAQAVSPQGKLLWQTELPDMSLQPMAYVPEADIVIHTVKNGDIVALHAKDGSVAWRANGGNEFQAPATLISDFGKPVIASTSYDGIFSIRDALTGDELVRRKVRTGSTASPVVSGDRIYVSTAWSIDVFGGLHALLGNRP